MGRSVVLGLLGGLGVCSKLSFPLIAAPLASWTLVTALWRVRREAGGAGRVWLRTLLAILVCAAVVAALCHKNWKHMWRHLRSQYGWVGEQYGASSDRWSPDFLIEYSTRWAEFCGWLWIGSGALVMVGLVVLRPLSVLRQRPLAATDAAAGASPPRAPLAALLFAFVANLGSCYFFPVGDPRYTVGALVALTLFVALGAGVLLRGRPLLSAVATATLAVGFMILLWSNSFLYPNAAAPICDVRLPAIGRLAKVLPSPCQDPDLRDDALANLAGLPTTARVGLGGDHRSFNLDNLRRRALQKRIAWAFAQVGYAGPEMPIAERIRKFEAAGTPAAWLICRPPADAGPGLWTTDLGQPMFDAVRADPRFSKLPWVGRLGDGTEVHAFRRVAVK